jgi:cell division protein FtsQ
MITSRVKKRQPTHLPLYIKMAIKLSFFLLFLSALFSFVGKFKSNFPIKAVKVYGIEHVDQAALQQALTPLVNKNFFAIDVETIKDRLLQSPWVAKAVVQRVWPDKILITVSEKKPIAQWNGATLLSNNGEIFNPRKNTYPNGLPKLIGPEGQHIQIMTYYTKLNGLLKSLHFKVARLELTPELSWNATFDNGMKLSAGYKDVLTRVSHFVKVYPKIIGNRVAEVEYIDLRYPNGLAVRWKTVS